MRKLVTLALVALVTMAFATTAIGQIADQIGYAQPATFSAAFRKRFGITPRDARTKNTRSRSLAMPSGHRK